MATLLLIWTILKKHFRKSSSQDNYNSTVSDVILFDMYEILDIITPEDVDSYFIHAGYF